MVSIVPLAPDHDRKAFSCGVEPLDRYLRQQAGQDLRKQVAVTFVLVEPSDPTVLGYYTLSATSVRLSDLPEGVIKELPRYPLVPALLLGRLAVDQTHGGKRYGELLLMDALERCITTRDIGWFALIVDAKDERAAAFYQHFHFNRFSPLSSKMFLLRETIKLLLDR